MSIFNNLHPFVVHFPIVLILLFVLSEAINFFLNKKYLNYAGMIFLSFGVIASVVAVLTGNLELQNLSASDSLTQMHYYLIERHETKATILLWYFLGVLIFKLYFVLNKKEKFFIRVIIFLLSVFGFYILLKTAHSGGKLVYKQGIGTNLIK